jgi:hypothetical protein
LFIVGAAILPLRGWPALGKTLLAYAYAAPFPVLIVMYIAIQKNWGTHYDVVPPTTPAFSSSWDKFIQIAFFPQMFLWIAYTVIVGVLAGTLAGCYFPARCRRLRRRSASLNYFPGVRSSKSLSQRPVEERPLWRQFSTLPGL